MSTNHLRYHWFVGNEYLGVGSYRLFLAPVRKHHWAMCCPLCGDVWARIVLDGHPEPVTWLFYTRCCPTHGRGFLLPFQDEFLFAAPLEVLKREILLISQMEDPGRYEITLLTNGDNQYAKY